MALAAVAVSQGVGEFSRASDESRPAAERLINLAVTLEVAPAVFKGLPAVAVVAVTNRSTKVGELPPDPLRLPEAQRERILEQELLSEWAFPRFDLLTREPAVSVVVKDPGGKQVVDPELPSLSAFWLRHPSEFPPNQVKMTPRVSLQPAESKSFLLDLGPHLSDLKRGQYAVGILVFSTEDSEGWPSSEVTVQLVEAAESRWRVLRRAVPALRTDERRVQSLDFVDKRMNTALLKRTLPPDLFSALALHIFFSGAAKAGSVSGAPLAYLDRVPSHLKPTAECFRYEVLVARKQAAEASRLRQAIARDHPDLVWRLEEVDAGQGLVRRLVSTGKAVPP